MIARIVDFLSALRRRNVYRVGVAYGVVAFVVWQVSDIVFPGLGLPPWSVTLVIVLTLAGFPIALVLAWAFEVTPEGVRRTVPPGDRAPSTDRRSGEDAPDEARGARASIVVLPFDNMSPAEEDAYLSDGLTDELTTDLSSLGTLRVISRNSATVMKNRGDDVRTIGRELGVRYVMEGSVRKAGDELRITAQLIDARTDEHIWAERYRGTMDDIFAMQERVSRSVVDALQVELSPEEERELSTRPIPDVRAYEHYLRARANLFAFEGNAIERAIGDLRKGLEILGENETLLKGLGMAYFQRMNAGLSDDPAVIDDIEDCAERIRKLDSEHPATYLLSGLAYVLAADFPGAAVQLREAYRRDPSDQDTLLWLGVISLSTGQAELSGRLFRRLHRVDPLSTLSSLLVGYHAYFEGRFREAATRTEKALRLGPENFIARWAAVRTFVAAGDRERARRCGEFLSERDPDSPIAMAAGIFLAGLDDEPGSTPEMSSALRAWAARDAESAQYLSDAYAFCGDEARALEWLEIALERGFYNHAHLARHDPFIAPYGDSPEWQDLFRRIEQRHREFESTLIPID